MIKYIPRAPITQFNELSPAEAERLAILAEECAEVIQIVGKILRHGYSSTHPDNEGGPDNRDMLEKELGDVLAIQKIMEKGIDISMAAVRQYAGKKYHTINHYLHHNRTGQFEA